MKNIYDKVKIIYDEKLKKFGVMNIVNIQCCFTIATTSDLTVAEQIKKAYCDGYYDGYQEKEKEEVK